MSGLIALPAPYATSVLRSLNEERDEQPTREEFAAFAKAAFRRDLTEVLGIVYATTTMLPLHDEVNTMLGPARDRDGRELRWTLWAPRHRRLIDIYRRRLPVQAELEDRVAFAKAHGLRYGIVEPGQRLNIALLKEWIANG